MGSEVFLEFATDVVDFVEFFPGEEFDFDLKRFAAVDEGFANFARGASDMAV